MRPFLHANLLRGWLLSAFCLLLLSVLIDRSHAQVESRHADIPFDFWVDGQPMSKGQYTIEFTTPSMLLLHRQSDGVSQQIFTVLAQPVITAPRSALVFAQRGDRWVLAEVWNVNGQERSVSTQYGIPLPAGSD